MKLTLLGFGGAFDPQVGNSSFWLEDFHGETILIDCGFTVFGRLKELGIDKIPDAILLTHLHADHAGSLTNEIFWLWFCRNKKPVRIYLPAEHFREPLWSFLKLQLITPEDFVEIVPLPVDGRIMAVDTFGQHIPGMPTFGYIFRDGEQTIALSGDTGNPATIFSALEAENIHPDFVLHEVAFNSEIAAHVYYKNLEPWLDRYRIYGYHCDPSIKPDDCKITLAWEIPELHFKNSGGK